jgi:hypothetical protein
MPIRKEVFIPNQRERENIAYFEPSYYLSHFSKNISPDGIIKKLMYRKWEANDLTNYEIVKNSQTFADLMWDKSVKKMSFLWHTGHYRDVDRIELEKKLVNYYNSTIFYRTDKK